MPKTFREEIEDALKGQDRKLVAQFAWRCAVSALPFLARNGEIICWKKEDMQKHLYAVFYALDAANAAAAAIAEADTAANIAAEAADAAAKARAIADAAAYGAATATSDDALSANVTAITAKNAVLYTTNAAAETALDADLAANEAAYYTAIVAIAKSDANSAAAYAASYADRAIRAAVYASDSDAAHAAYAYVYAAVDRRYEIRALVLKEAKNNKLYLKQSICINFYGDKWAHFLNALEKIGCGYWSKLYQQIFADGYIKDKVALETRLNVPEEIKEQGAAIVGQYLEELEKGNTRFNEARIIILGDKGAGKTSLTKKLLNPETPLDKGEKSTPGVETHLWEIEEQNINVNIWDFAGHTVTHAVHKLFLSERCLYIMVVDGRTEKTDTLYYWLNHVKNYGGNSKAIILVNVRDENKVKIPINSLKDKYEIEGQVTFLDIDDVSAVSLFRQQVQNYIVDNPSWSAQLLPESYFNVNNV